MGGERVAKGLDVVYGLGLGCLLVQLFDGGEV